MKLGLRLLFFSILVVFTPACFEPKTTIPVSLGQTKREVRKILGIPDLENSKESQTYFEDGLIIYYSPEDEVEEIEGSFLVKGRFKGRIHGISLGQDFTTVTGKLGPPDSKSSESYRWKLSGGRHLAVELYTDDRPDNGFPGVKRGQVTSIRICSVPCRK